MESTAIVLSYETGIIPASKKQVVMAVVKQYLDEFDEELPERIAESQSLVIKNQDDRELATRRRQEATAALYDIAKRRKALLGPAKEDIVDIEGMFNRVQKQITTIKDNYNKEIGRDFMEQQRIKREQEELLRKETEKQRLQAQESLIAAAIDQNDENLLVAAENVFVPEIKLADVERTTKTESGSTNVRMDLAVEVVDKPALASAIAGVHINCPHCNKEIIKGPDINLGFMEADLGYAKKYAKMMNWKPGIMFGLKISEVPVITGRTK